MAVSILLCAFSSFTIAFAASQEMPFVETSMRVASSSYLGVLTTVYVNSNEDYFTVDIPKPKEKFTGCAPGVLYLVDKGSCYQVSGYLSDIDAALLNSPSGTEAYFEVGGTQNSGETIVYRVNIVVK